MNYELFTEIGAIIVPKSYLINNHLIEYLLVLKIVKFLYNGCKISLQLGEKKACKPVGGSGYTLMLVKQKLLLKENNFGFLYNKKFCLIDK